LEEERERELEELYDSNLGTNDGEGFTIQRPGETIEAPEAGAVNKQTTESLTAGERIIEALEVAEADRTLLAAYEEEKARLPEADAEKLPRPTRNAIFAFYKDISAEAYVLQIVRAVPSSALHDALLVLPFSKVVLLLSHLDHWAQKASRERDGKRFFFLYLLAYGLHSPGTSLSRRGSCFSCSRRIMTRSLRHGQCETSSCRCAFICARRSSNKR
jgi:hypothetical protein